MASIGSFFSPIVPFGLANASFAPIEGFEVASHVSTPVINVLHTSIHSGYSSTISINQCVQEIAPQCVIIFILGKNNIPTFLGSGTLFQPDKIITARHILNDVRPIDLKIGFLFFEKLYNKNVIKCGITVLEDGADYQLDYAILGLPINIRKIQPAQLTANNDVLGSSLLIHHPGGKPQHFSVHQSIPSPHYQLQQLSFHDTAHISSGAGYRDCRNRLFAIHTSVNTSDTYAQRTALFVRTIIETNPQTILRQRTFSTLWNHVPDDQPLSHFFSSFLDIDEGRRQEALGWTPQIKSPTGREVLMRWANKNKAKYADSHVNIQGLTDRRLLEYDSWTVAVRKKDNQQREWVNLTEKIPTVSGHMRAAIHMGHKLSAAEYWEKGAQAFINHKISKYSQRYQDYKTPGHSFGFQSPTGKKFMKDSRNYAFEWGPLNQSHGSGGVKFKTAPAGKCWTQ